MIDPYPYKKEAADLLEALEDDALSQSFLEENGRLYASTLVGPREKLAPVLENPQVRQRLSEIAASGYRVSLYPVTGHFRLVILRSDSDAGVCVYDQLKDIDRWSYNQFNDQVFGVALMASVAMALFSTVTNGTMGSSSTYGYFIIAAFVGIALWSLRGTKAERAKLQTARQTTFCE